MILPICMSINNALIMKLVKHVQILVGEEIQYYIGNIYLLISDYLKFSSTCRVMQTISC